MLLQIEDLVKVYKGSVRANDGISLSVDEGEVFGLLGPNGAGKTTLVSQVIGLTTPTSGRILIDGTDVVADQGFSHRACSYQPQSQVPIEGMTPLQAIELVGRIRGGSGRDVRRRAGELIAALEIGQWANKPGHSLSGGVRRLVAFCMATVVPGRTVILDEPTNDIDPLRRRLLWQQVGEVSKTGLPCCWSRTTCWRRSARWTVWR